MSIFGFFRKKKETPAALPIDTPVLPGPEAQPSEVSDSSETFKRVGESSETSHSVSEDVKEIKETLKSLDSFARTELARQLTLEQLLDAVSKRVDSSGLGPKIKELKEGIRENQKKILSILMNDTTRGYAYQELADMTRLTADGVRSMISEMARSGVEFEKTKEGRRTVVKLGKIPLKEASETSDSSGLGS